MDDFHRLIVMENGTKLSLMLLVMADPPAPYPDPLRSSQILKEKQISAGVEPQPYSVERSC